MRALFLTSGDNAFFLDNPSKIKTPEIRLRVTFIVSSAVRITLSGGAQAKNIFWQAAGAQTAVTLQMNPVTEAQ